MRQLMGIVLGVALCAAPALGYADVAYTPKGRVVQLGPYDGPGFTTGDAVGALGIVATALALSLEASPAVVAVGPATILAWGAWRTAKYRPEAAKAQIQRHLAERDAVYQQDVLGRWVPRSTELGRD